MHPRYLLKIPFNISKKKKKLYTCNQDRAHAQPTFSEKFQQLFKAADTESVIQKYDFRESERFIHVVCCATSSGKYLRKVLPLP